MEAIQTSLLDSTPRSAAGSTAEEPAAGIEQRFDVPLVARLALKEKQIQQVVRPVIAVHKWFARRPGSLFRALLLSEFSEGPLDDTYYRPHRLAGLRVADPFMGGGTPLFEANRLGCNVLGWDVNPMAYWVVSQEIVHVDVEAYLATARSIEKEVAEELGHLYRTTCTSCGDEVPVKYFVWVKVHPCGSCGRELDLFPGYLLAADQRHPKNVVICSRCGELTETGSREEPGQCGSCDAPLEIEGPAGRGRCTCPHCGEDGEYPDAEAGPPRHRMVALEYHCWRCKRDHEGRFFKSPDAADLTRHAEATRLDEETDSPFVPADPIPPGDETDRLHRWGYRCYREMFNPRQRLGLARLAERISRVDDRRLRHALATNLSDLLRYQNMLCRYDTRSLKSLDIFSVHGFPVGLVQAESNLLGIQHPRTGRNVGSGGWSNVVEKFARAKRYCDQPFELRYSNGGKEKIRMPGEWIGDRRPGAATVAEDEPRREVHLHCGSATETDLEPASLDAVLTDPPYFANVQYAELMDFCYAWLRRLVGDDDPALAADSAHRDGDLTGNETLDRGLEHFVAGLSAVYTKLARALVPGSPFVFTYHHNSLDAYAPVAVALLDAGLACTASFPCPAEMGGSIHIHGSGSSIVDTVFVCRTTGEIPTRLLATDADSLARLVSTDLDALRTAGLTPTPGDARCITFGHLTRLAVWNLRGEWNREAGWDQKLERVGAATAELATWEEVEDRIGVDADSDPALEEVITSSPSGTAEEPTVPF